MESPYLAMLKKAQADSTALNTTTNNTLAECDLDNVDCPACGNTGSIIYQKDGTTYARECACMAKRRSIRRIQHSGIADMMARYTFDAYEVPDAARLEIKHRAKRFAGETTLVLEELEDLVSGESTEDEVLRRELVRALNGFLECLPQWERDLFLGRYLAFETLESLAKHTGRSVSGVHKKLMRLREKLRDYLQKEGIDL